MSAIGVLGGTFDPVHCGHVRLALEVRDALELDVVRMVPAPNPRLRAPPVADTGVRVRMLEAALAGIPGLELDLRELDRDGPTRTVDTLASLRAEHGRAPIGLILGADAFARLDEWHHWEALPELCHLIVARRPDTRLPGSGPVAALVEERLTREPRDVRTSPAGRVIVCDIPLLDISATRIRALLAAGRSVRCLVPDGTHEVLMTEKPYAEAN